MDPLFCVCLALVKVTPGFQQSCPPSEPLLLLSRLERVMRSMRRGASPLTSWVPHLQLGIMAGCTLGLPNACRGTCCVTAFEILLLPHQCSHVFIMANC